MSELIIKNRTQDKILCSNALIADTFYKRAKGLLGQKEILNPLVIKPCKQIHSWFMKFPFDAVFIDKEQKVVGTLEKMAPFKISPYVRKAATVIELPPGTVAKTGTNINDVITIERKDVFA